jgi:hypothetical protein
MLIDGGFDYSVKREREQRIRKAEKTAKDLNNRILDYLEGIGKSGYITAAKRKELLETLLKDVK